MSTLQIGLAIAGGVVLAGVVAHSTWTSRKNKPRQAEPLPQEPVADPVVYGQPQEPSFDAAPAVELPHEPVVSTSQLAPTYETSGGLDPVTDMARSMLEEATLHAQRVPDEAELARIAADKAASAKLAAARIHEKLRRRMIEDVGGAGADVIGTTAGVAQQQQQQRQRQQQQRQPSGRRCGPPEQRGARCGRQPVPGAHGGSPRGLI